MLQIRTSCLNFVFIKYNFFANCGRTVSTIMDCDRNGFGRDIIIKLKCEVLLGNSFELLYGDIIYGDNMEIRQKFLILSKFYS